MRSFSLLAGLSLLASPMLAQSITPPADNDPVKILASRLDLERYKATIKGLTHFGDRRQGTDRNANAVTWIEQQLKSYGCADVERIVYDYQPAAGGGAPRDSAARAAAQAAQRANAAFGVGQGGSRTRGTRARTGVNTDSLAQKDLKLRALNAQPTTPGKREEVYCTKVGSTRPQEMYIIGGHMDGHGWGEAANDDGSGSAIVMELARIFSMPDVKTDRSIRFALWNNEETGLNGARAYVAQREALQGKESPAGSGKYPEPKWLGMIQHDMMMFDHGMPRADGTLAPEQRPEADVNIEFQSTSKMAAEAQKLAWVFHGANEKYATDYPAAVGPHMTNTDSG
ncbi:MAG: M28 family peptidase, partial [Gemmatimonadaceae bacterium]